jgi:hypothetical protein
MSTKLDARIELELDLALEDYEVLEEEAKTLSITVDEHILRIIRDHLDENTLGVRQQ